MNNFETNILHSFLEALQQYESHNAFCIDETFYTYKELGTATARIYASLEGCTEPVAGLVANNDLLTYAAIFALWLRGKAYVPLHPLQPMERCEDIIRQVGSATIIDSCEQSRYADNPLYHVIASRELTAEIPLSISEAKDTDLAYVLFTSGSTGRPKGVPISRGNLAGFVDAFHAQGYTLTSSDRCLQMFDLTFDLSVQSYLMPLLAGACAFTVPLDKLKYMSVFELLDEQHLTFALMVPSVIHHLRPYLDELSLPEMRLSLFCGEALLTADVEAWSQSTPNARIDNTYGPTEDTIYCTAYTYKRTGDNKELNGTLCIGKAIKGTLTIIVDEEKRPVATGEKGELCLGGVQLTQGYWKNEEKNREAFFELDGRRWYRTGDLCKEDEDGDLLYVGRLDTQVKIQGYRIELGEIESTARTFLDGCNAVALVVNRQGHDEIALFIESAIGDKDTLLAHLSSKLPAYMLPSEIIYKETFPLNANGKIDRKKMC